MARSEKEDRLEDLCHEAARLLLEVLEEKRTLEQCCAIRLNVSWEGGSAAVALSGDNITTTKLEDRSFPRV